jgi:hypothetical protein
MYNSAGGQTVVYTLCNNQKAIRKSIPAHGFKNLEKKIREPKVSRLLPNLCDLN